RFQDHDRVVGGDTIAGLHLDFPDPCGDFRLHVLTCHTGFPSRPGAAIRRLIPDRRLGSTTLAAEAATIPTAPHQPVARATPCRYPASASSSSEPDRRS